MKSYAKINVFLKIISYENGYHGLISRFVLIENLFDELEFLPGNFESFTLKSNIKLENFGIFKKVLNELENLGFKEILDDFFKTNCLFLDKKIPLCAGLGGGSSNGAVFLKMCNEKLNLNLKKEKLMEISKKIGSDVSFFTSEAKSANVSGFGEIIENFDDEICEVFLTTPNIKSQTPKVYAKFDEICNFSDAKEAHNLTKLTTKEILQNYEPNFLNDLYRPVCNLYGNFIPKNCFLSGSGSSFFKIIS